MDVFGALSDPTRRAILLLLDAGPRAAGDIARQFHMSPPAVSQHLRTLREARLIQVHADAQRRIYSLDRRGFSELQRWLMRYRSFWNRKLDALETALRFEADTLRGAKRSAARSLGERSRATPRVRQTDAARRG